MLERMLFLIPPKSRRDIEISYIGQSAIRQIVFGCVSSALVKHGDANLMITYRKIRRCGMVFERASKMNFGVLRCRKGFVEFGQ